MTRRSLVLLILFSSTGLPASAEELEKLPMPRLAPTFANVHYGKHERQVIDFYKATSDKPTPLVLYIHGGGWQAGDKRGFGVQQYLNAGISVAAINYRYVKQAVQEKIEPPVRAPLEDAARELCSSFDPRRANGTSTRNASGQRAAPPALVRRCGLHFTMIWPIRKATIPLRGNRPGSIACGQRCPGFARSQGTARVDAELRLRSPCLWLAEFSSHFTIIARKS